MLDAETQVKYLKILTKGNTLKVSPLDAIDLVEKFDELVWEDQFGISTRSEVFKENLKKCKGKIVMKFLLLYKVDNKKILYWCPCDINDIALLAGASDYNEETGIYDHTTWIKKEDQLSFLGGDIKKACASARNKILTDFTDRYVNAEHPIANNIFYTVYLKNADTVNCARNIKLSPRPEKDKEEAK